MNQFEFTGPNLGPCRAATPQEAYELLCKAWNPLAGASHAGGLSNKGPWMGDLADQWAKENTLSPWAEVARENFKENFDDFWDKEMESYWQDEMEYYNGHKEQAAIICPQDDLDWISEVAKKLGLI